MKAARKRKRAARNEAPDAFRRQHGSIVRAGPEANETIGAVFRNESESPLAWLSRRKGADGKPFITSLQCAAGERLRADFTRAGLTPRVTANWTAPVARDRRAGDGSTALTDTVIAARQGFSRTLTAVGPEFAGLLLDVCCFLKGLETVERERGWPPRTARIVLTLALDRLVRLYGFKGEARGPTHARTRSWQAEGARPTME